MKIRSKLQFSFCNCRLGDLQTDRRTDLMWELNLLLIWLNSYFGQSLPRVLNYLGQLPSADWQYTIYWDYPDTMRGLSTQLATSAVAAALLQANKLNTDLHNLSVWEINPQRKLSSKIHFTLPAPGERLCCCLPSSCYFFHFALSKSNYFPLNVIMMPGDR